MRKCKFCAEDIQDKAVFCKHCKRRVRGIPLRRVIMYAILITFVVYALNHKAEIRDMKYKFDLFMLNVKDGWQIFKNFMNDFGYGVSKIKDYKSQTQLMEQMKILEEISQSSK